MRSDKFPEEWAEFIVETWCSDRCTRASERSSDEMRNPNKRALSAMQLEFDEVAWAKRALELEVQVKLLVTARSSSS